METCVMCVEGTRFKAGSGDVWLVLGLSLVVVGSQCRSGMLNVMRSPPAECWGLLGSGCKWWCFVLLVVVARFQGKQALGASC